ncbi:MAG: hypothetical protein IIB38_16415, partial [Candidatus Hydrogenedentes bacterium]|nr:hypothetical protein [Candidatus Hydrogenedentota bacterium]
DPFGIKPLYYADDGRTIRIASQVKALLAGGGVATSPEPAGHVGFHLWGYVPEPYTLFTAIRAVPAGSSLWIDQGGVQRVRHFFDVAEEFAAASAAPLDDERLRAALADSVAHHLIADVPVGVFLSAGLDSATITGLASESRNGDLDTMTLGFEEFRGTPRDETPLAATVAATYGTRHHTRWVTGADFHDDLEALLDGITTARDIAGSDICRKAEVTTIDVSNLGGRKKPTESRIVLITAAQTRIYWGRSSRNPG